MIVDISHVSNIIDISVLFYARRLIYEVTQQYKNPGTNERANECSNK